MAALRRASTKSVSLLALAGAAALPVAIAVPTISDRRSYEWNAWIVLSPLESAVVALAVTGVVLGMRTARIDTALPAGLLIGFGMLATVGSISLVRFADRLGTDARRLSVLVALGGLAILSAGWASTRQLSGAAESRVDVRALVVALAGTALASISLLLFFDGRTSLIDVFDDTPEFVYPPIAAIVVTLVALVFARSGSRPQFIAGILLATGAQSIAHYLGAMVGASRAWVPGGLGAGGFVGLLGALLVTIAGILAYGASRARRENFEP